MAETLYHIIKLHGEPLEYLGELKEHIRIHVFEECKAATYAFKDAEAIINNLNSYAKKGEYYGIVMCSKFVKLKRAD